jgi:hypothetical protein
LNHRREWWTDRESNSARRSCKDQLHPSARPEKFTKRGNGDSLSRPDRLKPARPNLGARMGSEPTRLQVGPLKKRNEKPRSGLRAAGFDQPIGRCRFYPAEPPSQPLCGYPNLCSESDRRAQSRDRVADGAAAVTRMDMSRLCFMIRSYKRITPRLQSFSPKIFSIRAEICHRRGVVRRRLCMLRAESFSPRWPKADAEALARIAVEEDADLVQRILDGLGRAGRGSTRSLSIMLSVTTEIPALCTSIAWVIHSEL